MVISLRKGIGGIFNFAVAGLILTEGLICTIKNAQTYNDIASLTQKLLGATGFSQLGWESGYSLDTRLKTYRKTTNQRLDLGVKNKSGE
jgi:hypothetical protein